MFTIAIWIPWRRRSYFVKNLFLRYGPLFGRAYEVEVFYSHWTFLFNAGLSIDSGFAINLGLFGLEVGFTWHKPC